MDRALFWLVLQRLPDTGTATLQKLYDRFGNIDVIAQASRQDLAGIIQGNALCQFDLFRQQGERSKPGQTALKDRDWLEKNNITLLTLDCADYPQRLKEIHYAPPILMVDGDVTCLRESQLAIVGSRKASPSGLEHAHYFSAELAECGLVITSGMALGIDSAAHRGALSVKRPTIAVIATGLDLCYPARHEGLVKEIRERGAIVSEFPLGTAPQKENFPRRNRIISGLSRGVLVVEAEEKSGSLITARYALEQNREVFAIPGSIKNPGSRGCHQLIREGAKLVENADDILCELEHAFGQIALLPSSGHKKNTVDQIIEKKRQDIYRDKIDDDEKRFFEFIDDCIVTVDEISRRAEVPVEQAQSLLLTLEIKGWIEMIAEGYRRT